MIASLDAGVLDELRAIIGDDDRVLDNISSRVVRTRVPAPGPWMTMSPPGVRRLSVPNCASESVGASTDDTSSCGVFVGRRTTSPGIRCCGARPGMRSQQVPATTAWKTAPRTGSTATPHGSWAMSWAITAPETRLRSNTSARGSMSVTSYRRSAHRARRDELNGDRFAQLAHGFASRALLVCFACLLPLPSPRPPKRCAPG